MNLHVAPRASLKTNQMKKKAPMLVLEPNRSFSVADQLRTFPQLICVKGEPLGDTAFHLRKLDSSDAPNLPLLPLQQWQLVKQYIIYLLYHW